jgi:hypothetical protein
MLPLSFTAKRQLEISKDHNLSAHHPENPRFYNPKELYLCLRMFSHLMQRNRNIQLRFSNCFHCLLFCISDGKYSADAIHFCKDNERHTLGKNIYVSVHCIIKHIKSTELSPFRGPAICAATQELPSILWNLRGQYHIHENLPLMPILSHITPIHTTPYYLQIIHLNIIHILVFLVVSFLLTFPPTTCMHSTSPFLLHALTILSYLI